MKNNCEKILSFYLILFYLFVLLILLLSGVSYSKYKSEKIHLISADIAKPIFVVQKEEPKIIKADSNFNNYEYNFTIMNYDSEAYSDVGFAYRIVVDVGNNNSILYKVIDDNGKEVSFSNNKSDIFLLDNHSKVKKSYKLIISKKNEEVKNGEIKIYVEGNQIVNG